jgi:3-hydroxyisobutyrate dehydrogenase
MERQLLARFDRNSAGTTGLPPSSVVRSGLEARMIVAVLGTGTMGAPMATNLLRAGMTVRVWNRTAAKTKPLVDLGAVPARTPAEAARDADIVLTMLADGPTVQSVMTGADGAVATMARSAIWLQMSTVGLADTDDFERQAVDAGVVLVDAPVLGSKQPAEQGALTVLASGPREALARCQPVFDTICARTVHLGEAGDGTRLKLVVNAWLLLVTNGAAECVALARRLGIDARQFLNTVHGSALELPYADAKAEAMITGDYTVNFPLKHASKDAQLVLDAAGNGGLDGVRAALKHMEKAARRGVEPADMAALYQGIDPIP